MNRTTGVNPFKTQSYRSTMRNNYNCELDLGDMKVSSEVLEILRMMVVKDPSRRATIQEVLEHDLFCCNVKEEGEEEFKINYDPFKIM